MVWITTGGFTSSSLSYGQVISEINATIANNATVVNVTVIDPDGTAALSQQAMTNSTLSLWNYTSSLTLNKAGTWTIYVNASNAGGLNSSTSTITVTTSSLTLISKWYGYSGQKILSASDISNNAAYDFFLYEMEDNMSTLSTNWASMLSSINNSYNQNIKVGLNYLLDCNINLTSCTNGLKLNITQNMSDLQGAIYGETLEYISLEIVGASTYNSTQKDSVLNDIAQNITAALSNKFPVYSKNWNSSSLDSAYISFTPMLYVTDTAEAAWINTEASYLKKNSTLNRIYEGVPDSLKDNIQGYYNGILKVLRSSTPNITSLTVDDKVAVMANGDVIVFNNASSESIKTVNVSNETVDAGKDVWDYTNKYVIENNTDGNFSVNISAYSATLLFFEDLDHIEMSSNTNGKVYKGAATSAKNSNYTTWTRSSNWGMYGALDFQIELYDPHYVRNNFITYYGWINTSAITTQDHCNLSVVIIADQNNQEIDNLIGNCSSTEFYGYISVADYANTDGWLSGKKGEADAWLALNGSLNIFIDGLDYTTAGENFTSRMKDLVDYVQISKGKLAGLNTYTAYQTFCKWAKGFCMKESCVERWNGANTASPDNYTRENWELELNKSQWYTSNNVKVICQAFHNRTTDGTNIILNYTELQNIYFASKVLGYDYFYLAQPDFNYAFFEYVYDTGDDLSNGYETDDSQTYYRRYENGIVYYNSSSGVGWIDDGRIINNVTVCFDLYDANVQSSPLEFTVNNPQPTGSAEDFSIADDWGVGAWSVECVDITSKASTNGRYLIEGWVGQHTVIVGQGLNIGNEYIYGTSSHSFYDTGTTDSFTRYGQGTNWVVNLSVSETKKTSIDTTTKITQSNTTGGTMNVTINSTYAFPMEIWTLPVSVSNVISLKYWNGTNAITLNYTNNTNCNSTNPTWNSSTVAGETHKACIMQSGSGYLVRFAAPSLSSRTYMIDSDSTPPAITKISPGNNSITSKAWVWANASLDEAGSWCGYSLNGTANVSMTALNTTYFYKNISSLPDGTHNITFSCNDTAGNMNSSSITYFTVDSTAPVFGDQAKSPASPTAEDDIQFNVTINDSHMDTVILTVNISGAATNYVVTTNASNVFYKTLPQSRFLDNDVVTSKWTANDTAGNSNTSSTVSFTISPGQASSGSPNSASGSSSTCKSFNQTCNASSECCGAYQCVNSRCAINAVSGLPANVSFNVYPAIITPPLYSYINPGDSFNTTVTISNLMQTKIMPKWNIICDDGNCVKEWCTLGEINNTIAPMSSINCNLECDVPADADNKQYTGKLVVWVDGYSLDAAKTANIEITVHPQTLSVFDPDKVKSDVSDMFKGAWEFLTTPIWCLSRSCYKDGIAYTGMMVEPVDFGIGQFDSVNLLVILLVVICVAAVFAAHPWKH